MTKKILFFFLFCNIIYGQKLHHQMLSSQGSVATTFKGVKVSQTIAQQSVIGTSVIGKKIISQGFQQSAISNKAVISSGPISTKVYPNPITDFVNFKFSVPIQGTIGFSIFDIHGRFLYHQDKKAIGNILTIDNLILAEAEYIIELKAKNYSFTTKIIKLK